MAKKILNIFQKFNVQGKSFNTLIDNIKSAKLAYSTKLKYLREVDKQTKGKTKIQEKLNEVKSGFNELNRCEKHMKKEDVKSDTEYIALGKKWQNDIYVEIKTNVENKGKDKVDGKYYPMTLAFKEKDFKDVDIKNKYDIAKMCREKLVSKVNEDVARYGFTLGQSINKFDIDIFDLGISINTNRTGFKF